MLQHRAVPARVQYCTGTGEYPDIRRSEISEDFVTVSGSTWTTHTSYLYLPDGKMATTGYPVNPDGAGANRIHSLTTTELAGEWCGVGRRVRPGVRVWSGA